jgi:23S rRNA (cytosine1962-C5)-methyltransferase
MKSPVIQLKKGKDEAVRRFHPWIFSGAIDKKPAGLKAGDTVQIQAYNGDVLGTGFYENDSIAVKLFSFADEQPNEEFYKARLSQALNLRKQLKLTDNPDSNAYRLVHSEGDGLPGLIIDIYHTTAVMQTQTAGMFNHRQIIASVLNELMHNQIDAIYHKSMQPSSTGSQSTNTGRYLIGNRSNQQIIENNALFRVDWETGQKTGFFIDQRENRALIKQYAAGKMVLNAFSYSGGFSVSALLGDALEAVSVDSSKKAIELCDENILLNKLEAKHQSVCQDAKKYLEDLAENEFDIIILDPPAFAKNHHNRHRGLQGYKYINFEALKKIRPQGLLVTFSCSQAVDRDAFQGAVMAAAIEAGREVRILHQLSQPADHPVSIFHPEGNYLKGLVLKVI